MLEDQRYTHCILCTSHSERVTCFWLTSPCHHYSMDDSDTSARPASRTYLEPDTSPNSPSRIINSTSIANTANKYPRHTHHPPRDNQVRSIWSTGRSVVLCHINLLEVLHTSSASLTTQLGRCGLLRSKPKIECSRSSLIGSLWLRNSPVEI